MDFISILGRTKLITNATLPARSLNMLSFNVPPQIAAVLG